jgi:hypothetical protein
VEDLAGLGKAAAFMGGYFAFGVRECVMPECLMRECVNA